MAESPFPDHQRMFEIWKANAWVFCPEMKVYISLIQLFKRLPRYANCDVFRVFFRWQAITEYGLRGQWREAVSILSDPWDPQQLGKKWADPRSAGPSVGNPTHHWTTGRKNPPFQARCFLGWFQKKALDGLPSLKSGRFQGWLRRYSWEKSSNGWVGLYRFSHTFHIIDPIGSMYFTQYTFIRFVHGCILVYLY